MLSPTASRRLPLALAMALTATFTTPITGAQTAIEVTTTSQFGPGCTLSDAIVAANLYLPVGDCPTGLGKDTIHVPAGVYVLTTPAVVDDVDISGLPLLRRPITIQGDGAATTIIKRDPSAPAFRLLRAQAPFTLTGVSLEGGDAGPFRDGGAISAETFYVVNPPGSNEPMRIHLRDVVFRNNRALYGGALGDAGFYFGPFVEFDVEAAAFIDNHAINGGGAIRISPNAALRVRSSAFERNYAGAFGGAISLHDGAPALVDISDSTFAGNESGMTGGAIQATAPILTRVTFLDNRARDGGGSLYSYGGRPLIRSSAFSGNSARRGGAIEVHGGSIEIDGSTFAGNAATDFTGGALHLDDRPGTSRIVNSTFSHNRAVDRGGALYLYGGGLSLNHATVTGNESGYGPGIALGWWGGSTVTIANSIVAGNRATWDAALDVQVDESETLTSLGHNVIGSELGTRGRFSAPGDQIGTADAPLDAGLLPLADNGGATQTHALAPSSPGVDGGNPAGGAPGACAAVDQRGSPRPGRGSLLCDAGSFEYQAPIPTHAITVQVNGSGTVSGLPNGSCSATCTASVPEATRLDLAAVAAAGWAFESWASACSGHLPSCTLEVTGPLTISATFVDVPAATTTTLTVSAASSVATEPVHLQAEVASADGLVPAGVVSFRTAAGLALGDVTLDPAGRAGLTTGQLPVGIHVIRAEYLASGDWLASEANATHHVAVALTTTALFSSVPASVAGEAVAFTATVHAVSPATGVPAGSVSFLNASTGEVLGNRALDASAAATIIVALPTGANTIKAVYLGDNRFSASAGEITHVASVPSPARLDVSERIAIGDTPASTVTPATPIPTTVAVSVSSAPFVYSQPIVVTASISAAGGEMPAGTVTFTAGAGGASLGTVPLVNGRATVDAAPLPVGTHAISVEYHPYYSFVGGSATTSVTVIRANTEMTLQATAPASVFGQTVSFVARVRAAAPAIAAVQGSISFIDVTTGAPLGDRPIDAAGNATLTTTLAVGTERIGARYEGGIAFAASSAEVGHVVSRAATAVAVSVHPLPAVAGRPQTLTAAISPVAPGSGEPDGTVTFIDSTTGTTLGIAAIDLSGHAQLVTAALQPGQRTITAAYPGSSQYAPATGSVSVTIEQWPVVRIAITESIGFRDEPASVTYNTAAGNGVVAAVEGARVIFSNVIAPGITTSTAVPNPIAPARFLLTSPPAMYDITTTAQFSGTITVCLLYPAGTPFPRMMHRENGLWVDRTTSINTSRNEVCGVVTSLSPFAVFTPEPVAGRMTGAGEVGGSQFELDLDERVVGNGEGRLRVRGPQARGRARDTFDSVAIAAIVFADPHLAMATGVGRWNGRPGYRFELAAEDRGEPGRRRDRISFTITDPDGVVVATHDAVLEGGNIQSHSIRGQQGRPR